jgi:succinate-semialdehyde dehydrogenase/glutarate-semialdehyde dehydrogenase
VTVISPWNFPFWMPIKAGVPQLALGNTILFKPAPNVSLCAEALQDIMHSAGFGDAFQVLYLDHDDTDYCISNSKVRGVAFTGSTRGGKIIGEIAGKHL